MRILTIALCLLATPALADVAGIASVIDGDTLEIHGQRIRLYGIDAPESRQLCHLDGRPWQCGKDAANALADKIARRPVTCEDLGRDRYKRIIARCIVAGEGLEKWMVVNGWALAYRRYSLDYVVEEADAQAAARRHLHVREQGARPIKFSLGAAGLYRDLFSKARSGGRTSQGGT